MPVQYATQPVVVRAFIDRVEVLHQHAIIAVHQRVPAGQWSLQLPHYVTLLETKPGLLDSGKPFEKRAWTRSQQLFRDELEYRYQGEGTRRFIDVLLLAKQYDWHQVCRAIEACCKHHAFNEQAVLLELQADHRDSISAVTLDLTDRPELTTTSNGIRSLACYDSLLDQFVELHDDAQLPKQSLEEARSKDENQPIQKEQPHPNDIFPEEEVTQHNSNRFTRQASTGIGIVSSLAQVTGYVVGVCNCSQALFTS